MKLCMLAPEFLPVWGGVGTYIVELIRHLPKDIEVHVLTPRRFGLGSYDVASSDFDLSSYFGSNVKVHFISTAKDTFFYNASFQYACFKYIPNLIREENIDLIHSHTAHMSDLLVPFSRIRIPTVTTIHTTIRGQRNGTKMSGIGFSGLEHSEKLTYLAYPLLGLAESVYFRQSRYYITVSNWMREQIKKEYSNISHSSILTIHNSVDTELFSPRKNMETSRDIILFTGRLVAAKGIGYLIEAIPRILKEHPRAYFLFIGAGNSTPYRTRLKEMGVSESDYKFIGYLKEAAELVEYYRAASIYVAPTLYENLPIRVLEAMACGLPVVASNVCAIPEAIDNGLDGVLTPPCSIQGISEAVNHLLSDSKFRNKMGENARNKVFSKFRWNANVTKTVNVYKQILNIT